MSNDSVARRNFGFRHSDFIRHSSFAIRHFPMSKIDQGVILAAGRGTRMRELTADLPKPMIEVRGKPVLQHIIEGLRDGGVKRFLVIVGYRADAVQNFFADGARYEIDIQYATKIEPDGTGPVAALPR